MRRAGCRIRLHDEILRGTGYSVLVWPMVHHRSDAIKIIVGRRSRCRPLEGCRLPGIVRGLRSLEHAPEQIDHEDELSRNRDDGCISHERLQRHQFSLVGNFGELRVAASLSGHAEVVHGHEDRVGSSERDEEVQLAQRFVHHAPEHFREPIISRREDAEDRRDAHDQVEVSDHEICVVELNIEHGLRQERAAQTAGDEERNEADGVKHRGMEAYAALVHRPQPVERFDG